MTAESLNPEGYRIMEPEDLFLMSLFRGWIRFRRYFINMYARCTKRWINGELHQTIDLANFNVDEEKRGQGHFTLFLDELEELADNHGKTVYVESILNERLFDFLQRRGYQVAQTPDCLFREPRSGEEPCAATRSLQISSQLCSSASCQE